MDSLSSIKQCLNIFAVFMNGFSKVPQIRQLLSSYQTLGLSFLNLNIELFCWSITWSYFTFHGYLWTDFLEYPLLLIQQITVICLYFHINKTLSKIGTFAFLVVYFLTVYSWLQSPEWFLQILISINTPLGSFGKICQIYEIVKSKSSDNVSAFPYISSAVTSAARTLTVMISTQDVNLYIVYGVSIIQNLAVALVTYIYSSKKKKED